jgi:type I restriction enzyme S subunit
LSGGKRVPKGEKFSDEETDYFYLRPNEVDIQGIDKVNIPFLSAEIYNQLKRYKIVSGELCVSIVGTIGKTALIDTDDLEIGKTNLILSENFIKLTPKQKIIGLFYFYYFYSFIFKIQVNREYTIKPTQKLGIDK